jgi:hypothetical protein
MLGRERTKKYIIRVDFHIGKDKITISTSASAFRILHPPIVYECKGICVCELLKDTSISLTMEMSEHLKVQLRCDLVQEFGLLTNTNIIFEQGKVCLDMQKGKLRVERRGG